MRIRATCGNCGREFLPQQMIDAGGHCPWCGRAFTRDYTALLIRAFRQAEEAGTALEDALRDMAGVDELAMEIDEQTVLEPLENSLRSIRRRRARV